MVTLSRAKVSWENTTTFAHRPTETRCSGHDKHDTTKVSPAHGGQCRQEARGVARTRQGWENSGAVGVRLAGKRASREASERWRGDVREGRAEGCLRSGGATKETRAFRAEDGENNNMSLARTKSNNKA